MKDAFSCSHPIINFVFYIGALGCGMCFLHPAFLTCSLVLSLLYYMQVKKESIRHIIGILGVWISISALNPLFNTQGESCLFTYLGGRPYTLEALYYGIAIATMFVSILTWFATYNHVMTSDKFLYIFGKMTPSLSMIFTIVFQMVPCFQKKVSQITEARKHIGKALENGKIYEKVTQGMIIVSALTTWALEGGVIMADSMRSRGYGIGKRTFFTVYHMNSRDKTLLGIMLILLGVIVICALNGGMMVSYTPKMNMAGMDNVWTLLGIIVYVIFLSIPIMMDLMEELMWHISRLKI